MPHFNQTVMSAPCGRTRREFLWEAGGGFAGMALTAMLDHDHFFGTPAQAATDPLSARNSHFHRPAKACICLFMYGGPSQVDLFDPKPELTRFHGQAMPGGDKDRLFRVRNPGTLLASSRKFSQHGDSGLEISDLFPNLSRHADDMVIFRGSYADSFAHGSGLLQMNTGMVRQGFPSLGSWVTYGLGSENRNLPGYVVLLDHRGGPINGPPNWSSGFMPAGFQGTQFRASGEPILNLQPPSAVSPEQQRGQLELLGRFNQKYSAGSPRNTELQARIASYELAYRMQSHAPRAVDLSRETQQTQRLYGLDSDRTKQFGRRCLLARRLVERGVRFVQIYSGGGHGDDTWDAHGDVNKNHETHCGATDLPIAGLLSDLKQRGLLDETLVFWTGEFGRTPTGQGGKGRDHSPRGFSTWMAGGGLRGGQAIGATDDFGFAAVENKTHVNDLHANMLHMMGLDHEKLTYFHDGREHRLTNVSGRILPELTGRSPA
jgi:hypothetical protein